MPHGPDVPVWRDPAWAGYVKIGASSSSEAAPFVLGREPPSPGVASGSSGTAPLGSVPLSAGVAPSPFGDAPLEDQVLSPFFDHRPPATPEETEQRVPRGNGNILSSDVGEEYLRDYSARKERCAVARAKRLQKELAARNR